MFKKKFIIPTIVMVLIVTIGFIQINIINTKALSPIGNTADNYALVSEEFGEDFTEFIKDNAEIKIYPGEGEEDASIKVKEKEIRFKKENPFIKVFITTGTKIKEVFLGVKDKIDNKVNNINKKNEQKENTNEKLDGTVDDFIKNREENKSSIEGPQNEKTNWEDNLQSESSDESGDSNVNSDIENNEENNSSEN